MIQPLICITILQLPRQYIVSDLTYISPSPIYLHKFPTNPSSPTLPRNSTCNAAPKSLTTSQMLQHLTKVFPYIPYTTESSFSLSQNRIRIEKRRNSPPADMSRRGELDAEGFDAWLAKSKKDYYKTTIEARDAPEIIWNGPVVPWMQVISKYEIQWGDKAALTAALVCSFFSSRWCCVLG